MYWSPTLPMGEALEGEGGGELETRGGGGVGGWDQWSKAPSERRG